MKIQTTMNADRGTVTRVAGSSGRDAYRVLLLLVVVVIEGGLVLVVLILALGQLPLAGDVDGDSGRAQGLQGSLGDFLCHQSQTVDRAGSQKTGITWGLLQLWHIDPQHATGANDGGGDIACQ